MPRWLRGTRRLKGDRQTPRRMLAEHEGTERSASRGSTGPAGHP
jgi:hypothetical protein